MARKTRFQGFTRSSSGSRPGIQTTGPFEKALAQLSFPIGQRVLARMQVFAQEWVTVTSEEEIAGNWRLKQVHSDEACRKRHLWQLCPTDQTRVWLWTDKEQNSTFVLFVWHNTDKAGEDKIISRLCNQIANWKGNR